MDGAVVLEGTEPNGLSLEEPYGVPIVWQEQRRGLGFTPRSEDPQN